MQKEIEDILKASFDIKELSLENYYRNCVVYCISTENNCYELGKKTKITFNIASIAIINRIPENGYFNLCIFATNPLYRKCGFGQNLLRCVCDIYHSLYLHVRISNEAAISLYTRMGFKIEETISNYYSYTDTTEDAYLMKY